MTVVAESADEMMFRCLACPRQVVVGKRAPRLTVIEAGDWGVPHAGATCGSLHDGELAIDASVAE